MIAPFGLGGMNGRCFVYFVGLRGRIQHETCLASSWYEDECENKYKSVEMLFLTMLYLKGIQCPVRIYDSLGESKVNNRTRPEGQPRHIVDSDTA